MADVTLADAKARLSALVARAAQGEAVRITRRGKPVAQLTPAEQARRPIDLAELRRLTDSMPETEPAAETLRRLRDDERY